MNDDLPTISESILADRYLAFGETTRRQAFKRVARALAATESPSRRIHVARLFYANMLHGAIGAGRIMANAGTSNHATMVNCFVHPIGSTTGGGIASAAEIEGALAAARSTLAMGGGVGYDFTPVAPSDAWVEAEASRSRGVCACIDQFDEACRSVTFEGTRRGAQMAALRCDHPDLLDFVVAKRGRRRWATFNVSVAVTSEFMHAVECDAGWMLRHRATPGPAGLAAGAYRLGDGDWCYAQMPARRLWRAIVECARESAEPGLLFIDTINAANDLAPIETICATNPCGEQPLPPWGSCVLGPIDVSRLVHHPFGVGGTPEFDFVRLGRYVRVQVRLLDNTLDLTRWPLPEQEREAHAKRRIGVGITGLADTLTMMRLPYGAPAARSLAEAIAACMRDHAYGESAALAAERGPYPLFDVQRCLGSGRFAAHLPSLVRDAIALNGLRNSHLLSFAPAGSVSLAFFDNCSSGIEPAYDWVYRRQVRIGNRDPLLYRVENRAYRLFRRLHGSAPLPAYFVKASEVAPADHVAMLAALQPFVDAAISKTVIVSPHATVDDVGSVFFDAWRAGLKGITVFRPDASLDAVLVGDPSTRSAARASCIGCY